MEREKHKATCKPIEQDVATTLKKLKQGGYFETITAYKVPDYDKNTVSIIEEDGTVLMTRRMLPEERQTTIYHQMPQAK